LLWRPVLRWPKAEAEEGAAVLEPVVLEPAVLEPVLATAMVMVLATVLVVVGMGSLLAMAMEGPASRSATAVGQRSLPLAASIARVRQPGASPARRLETLIRIVE
jgi:hypothetical protein